MKKIVFITLETKMPIIPTIPVGLVQWGAGRFKPRSFHTRPPQSAVKHRTYECSPSEKHTPIPLILVLKNNPFSCKTRTFSLLKKTPICPHH